MCGNSLKFRTLGHSLFITVVGRASLHTNGLLHAHDAFSPPSGLVMCSSRWHCICFKLFVQTHLAVETRIAPWCKSRIAVPISSLHFPFRTFCPNLTPPVIDKKLGNKSWMWMRVMSSRPCALRLPLHYGHSCLDFLCVNILCLLERT